MKIQSSQNALARKMATEMNVNSSEHTKHNLSTTAAINIHCCFLATSKETSHIELASVIFVGMGSISSIYEGFSMQSSFGNQYKNSFFDRPCMFLGLMAFILILTTIVETTDKAIENMIQLK